MGLAEIVAIGLDDIVCGECGIMFAVPSKWRLARVESKATFYCPNGHPRAYVESAKDRELKAAKEAADGLRKQLAHKDWSLTQANRMLEDEKRKAAAVSKRVGNGTCPCCKRTFKQLQRHMECKHPSYKDGEKGGEKR